MGPPSRKDAPPAWTTAPRGLWRSIVSATAAVQHEPADRREGLGHRARTMPGGSPVEHEPVPVERRFDGSSVEARVAQGNLVLRLAEDGHAARQEPFCGVVEVVLVTMCHEHGVEL